MRTIRPTSLLLALSLATGAVMTAHAQTATPYTIPTDGTLLSISSEAEAKRVPDVATLSAGVMTQAPDGDTAMRQNAQQMDKVMQAIRAAGIAEKDVQTSGITLYPQYTYKEGQSPKINGYQATNRVNLKVRDLTRLGKVLETLALQGANQINGPSFEIDRPEPVYDEARVAALKQAQDRAETYAKSLGLRVRRIVSISEGRSGGIRPVPVMRMRAMAADAEAPSAPVSPGESSLSVNLDVTFELGR